MEMIAAVIFAIMMFYCMAFCLFKGVNITINVQHKHEYPEVIRLDDQFDTEGNPKKEDERATIDDVLKTVNSVMLGQEEE